MEEWTEDFKEQYLALKPKSAEKYDAARRVKSPSWQTIAKLNGTGRWVELLSILNLPKATEPRPVYTVMRTIRQGDLYITEEEYWHGLSLERVEYALEHKINFHHKSLEKLEAFVKYIQSPQFQKRLEGRNTSETPKWRTTRV